MPPPAVKEVRQPYPLPARPRSGSNVSANATSANRPIPATTTHGSPNLAVPRSSTFFSAPQPPSPRQPYLQQQAASPKFAFPSSNTPTAASHEPEPTYKLKKAITADELRPTSKLVNWGTGWVVHWRRWSGPSLLELPEPSITSVPTRTAKPRSDAPPPAKKSRAAAAFDDLMGEETASSNPSRPLRVPVASSSRAAPSTIVATPPLKSRLEALPAPSAAPDSVERARSDILTLAEGKPWLTLVPFVEYQVAEAGSELDPKGKGKVTESVASEHNQAVHGVSRTFWVFSLVPAGPLSSGEPLSPLDSLEFSDLVSKGSGHFSHRTLVPSLYPSPTEPTMIRPASLKASSFPSCIAMSAELQAELAPTKGDLQAAYTAFVSSLSSTLISALLASPMPTTNFAPPTRLGSSVVFVPPALTSDSLRPRIPPTAVSTSFTFSLASNGLLVSPVVQDLALRQYPVSFPPLTLTPVILAPFGTKAIFVKAYPPGTGLGKIRDEWSKVLAGTGVRLQEKESWVLCRVALPPRAPPPLSPNMERDGSGGEFEDGARRPEENAEESIEVVWPKSLILIDGTRPSPSRSPEASPLRALPTTFPSNNGDADSPMTDRRPSSSTHFEPAELITANADLDLYTRRRLASRLRRQAAERKVFRDPVKGIADGVGKLLENLVEVRERKEREHKEEKVREEERERDERERRERDDKLSLSSTPILPIPPSSLGIVSTPETKFHPPAGAPINMRTPISLGGSSTEAPSPADGFGLPPTRGPQVVIRPDVETIYASPAESQSHAASSGALTGNGHGIHQIAQSMPMASIIDQSFDNFDWEDFTSGPLSMPSAMRNDYDDGMGLGGMELSGLTDDDFSFFDDHASSSLPTNSMSFPTPILPPQPSGLQSSGPSPKFVDHFSHLGTSSTPFASAGSPGSPFGHLGSPHIHHSPLLSFPFDSNALGLAGTPGATVIHSAPSPFKIKTPFTPHSPFVELGDLSEQEEYCLSGSVSETPAGFSGRNFVFPPHQTSRIRAFDPVNFGQSHETLDEKYDPRKGKFGLPSPVSDTEEERLNSMANTPFAGKPWFAIVCDPRVTLAGELKRKRRGKAAISSTTKLSHRSWVRNDPDSDDETEEEEASEDDSFLHNISDHTGVRRAAEHLARSDYETWLDHSFGPALVVLREHLAVLLEPPSPRKRPTVQPSKETGKRDSEFDAAAGVCVDQAVYNPDFRSRVADALLSRSPYSQTVSARAIQLTSDYLSRFVVAQSVPSLTPAGSQSLVTLSPPAIILRAQQAFMQVRTPAVRFWKSMGFEPLAGPKDVTAFAIFEEGGDELPGAVKGWMQRVADAYQALKLGRQTPGVTSSIEDGLAIVPAGWLSESGVKDPFRTTLCSRISEAARFSRHVVVYLLTPPGALPTARDSPVSLVIQQLSKSKSASLSLVVYPVSLSSIVHSRSLLLGDSETKRLDRLAFAVYDQLLVPIAKLHFPVPETFVAGAFTHAGPGPASRPFQFPAITVAPNRKPQIQFDLAWPPSSLEVMHRHRFLHIGYTIVPVKNESKLEWLVASCIDEKGEVWKIVPKLLRCPSTSAAELVRAKIIGAITRTFAESADVEWRVVISRLGIMTKDEMKGWHQALKEWIINTPRPIHVTIACVDLQPSLSVVPLHLRRGNASSTSPLDVEEGEVMRISHLATPTTGIKPAHLDTQASVHAFTPSEPVFIGPGLVTPISTYLIHVPRIASFVHTVGLDPLDFPSSSPAISVLGLHILTGHSSRASTLSISLEQHVADIRQSFIEQSALAQVRWGTSGRVPWHLEAVRIAAEVLVEIK